jgi:hypothetical protein
LSHNQKKFSIHTALAKALWKKSGFIFWLKPALAQTNLRLKPEAVAKAEAIHKADEPTKAIHETGEAELCLVGRLNP